MDVIVVGANIGGAVSAGDLAASGHNVIMLERDLKRKKPCGGAIPPKAISEFGVPSRIIERKTRRAVVIGPSGRGQHRPGQGIGLWEEQLVEHQGRGRAVEEEVVPLHRGAQQACRNDGAQTPAPSFAKRRSSRTKRMHRARCTCACATAADARRRSWPTR